MDTLPNQLKLSLIKSAAGMFLSGIITLVAALMYISHPGTFSIMVALIVLMALLGIMFFRISFLVYAYSKSNTPSLKQKKDNAH